MKITFEVDLKDLIRSLRYFLDKPLEDIKFYADQAAASASKANTAARNAEMALEKIKKGIV